MTRFYKARNKRLIPRTSGGQFTRASLGCGVCPECGTGFLVPQWVDDENGFPKRVLPERCAGCEKKPKS